MNMIEVKMSFSSPAEAAAFFAHHAIAQAQSTSTAGNVKSAAAETKKAEPKPADKPSASAVKQTSTPSTESQSKAASQATSNDGGGDAPKVTYPELQQAVMKVVALGDVGKAELKKILAGFNLTTFKDSAEAIWPEAIKQVNAAHAALAAA